MQGSRQCRSKRMGGRGRNAARITDGRKGKGEESGRAILGNGRRQERAGRRRSQVGRRREAAAGVDGEVLRNTKTEKKRSCPTWCVRAAMRQESTEVHGREALSQLMQCERMLGPPTSPSSNAAAHLLRPGARERAQEYAKEIRPSLVCWTLDLCEHFQLALPTASLSVALIDRVAPEAGSSRALLQALALASLSIAAKIEECESDTPSSRVLANASRGRYTPEQINRSELSILQLLHWRVRLPTTAHFLEVYLSVPESSSFSTTSAYSPSAASLPSSNVAADTDVLRHASPTSSPRELRDNLSNECGLLLSSALEHYELAALTLPSVLAASVLALARFKLSLPPWTHELARLTGLKQPDFQQTLAALRELDSPGGPQSPLSSCAEHLHSPCTPSSAASSDAVHFAASQAHEDSQPQCVEESQAEWWQQSLHEQQYQRKHHHSEQQQQQRQTRDEQQQQQERHAAPSRAMSVPEDLFLQHVVNSQNGLDGATSSSQASLTQSTSEESTTPRTTTKDGLAAQSEPLTIAALDSQRSMDQLSTQRRWKEEEPSNKREESVSPDSVLGGLSQIAP